MKQAVAAIGIVNLVAFTALGVVTVVQWRSRRSAAAAWAAATFAALGAVVILGRLVPGSGPNNLAEKVVQRVDVAILVLFPYLLFRFSRAFGRPPRGLERFVTLMTVALVAATFALPYFPEAGASRPTWFVAYLVAFLFHWTVLSVVVALRLSRAGRRQPTVARRRMQMLASAAAAITLAILLVALSHPSSVGALVAQALALASAAGFLLGLAPPPLVRTLWRRPEQDRLQLAIADLMQLARTPADIVARVLEPMAGIVGARAIELRDDGGDVVGAYNVPADGDDADAERIEVEASGLTVAAWTSPYAPYFGGEELTLLRTLGSLTALALDRARLFEREHETRVALERTDELRANFVALAAHELRTPVTTIHGFVQTLHSLGDRLPEERREELRRALEQQTARMALLVEQLLDLSRLDADAIEIAPQRFRVRDRLEELVRTAAGERADTVEIETDPDLEAFADQQAFDRILSNLVTNAFRYGTPPVIVRASQTDNHLRVTVEDRGAGVAPEFVPDLFERFSRSERSRGSGVTGTGLGLAIARSYARAHRGDLLYEDAEPHGACFQLVLPAEPDFTAARLH